MELMKYKEMLMLFLRLVGLNVVLLLFFFFNNDFNRVMCVLINNVEILLFRRVVQKFLKVNGDSFNMILKCLMILYIFKYIIKDLVGMSKLFELFGKFN